MLGYNTVIDGIYTPDSIGVAMSPDGRGQVTSHRLWRDGMCQHVTIVHGRCPSGPGEVMASQRSRTGLIVDVVLALVAVTGWWPCVPITMPRHPRLRDAARTRTACLVVALLGVRLLPLSCRWIARRTRASQRMGLFLAFQQVARRPVGLRLGALLAVAAP